MNCKHVQELLPLYIGRDLEENYTRMIAAHMQSCVECAGSADEYRETRQLLQQFTPPLFSEAVYAGIRQRVLREIEREATAPGLSRLLESLFRPRLRWAVATALLIAVFLFAFYFTANRRANLTNDRQQLADSRRTVDVPTPSSIKESEGLPPASTVQRPVRGLAGGIHQPQRRKSPAAVADRTRSVAVNTPDARSKIAGSAPEGSSGSEPDAAAARDSTASEKPLRVEMQTRDPNIRIIWFTHQPTKQDSPSKFSKGT